MATGPSTANANALVDSVTGAAGGGYLQFHVGDPGSAGTSNQAGSTTRIAVAWPAASSATATQTGTATLASWAGGTQTLSHYSLWSASSGGTFRGSGAWTASRGVVNGDALNVSGIVWSCSRAS
jgi:hypothetical protein